MNYKRKSRRWFFLLMWLRTPPIFSEFREGGMNPPSLGTPLIVIKNWTILTYLQHAPHFSDRRSSYHTNLDYYKPFFPLNNLKRVCHLKKCNIVGVWYIKGKLHIVTNILIYLKITFTANIYMLICYSQLQLHLPWTAQTSNHLIININLLRVSLNNTSIKF